jgi:lactate permease
MLALAASLPILLVIATMAVLRWRAVSAGLLGLAVALLLAVVVFGFGDEVYPALGPVRATGGALGEALFVTATILWIIFPALCIYEMQARTGAFDTIRSGLSRLSSDPRILVLLVAWFFGLFMEGVAGFGTPVALAAPILVGLGFSPVKAVALALIGHAAGVSFGAVGTPVLPLMAATGLSGIELARPAALLHALLGWILVAALFVLASEGKPVMRGWRWAALAAGLFLAPFLVLAWFVGPELPTVGGAIIGGALFAFVLRRADAQDGTSGPTVR